MEDEAGNPVIFQGMVQDITPQRLLTLSLEESNKRYEYITKASFDAIWDWDLVNETLSWGEGFQHIFGYDLKDLETNKAADDLYKRNKELHEFGYIVSHNLRSPVANIMGITMLLELDKEDPATIDKCIADLKYSINRLDDVIRDLSKILSVTDGSAGWTKEDLDVTQILGNVTADLKDAIKHSDARLQIPATSYSLHSNKAYLYSVLFNLIGNAIKYKSQKRPEITVSIDQSVNATTIKVSDNGIGIDLEKHSNDLFKPYKRFSKHLEGKGLGLFLVKSHVEALNGIITVESEPGKGTTFTIVFTMV